MVFLRGIEDYFIDKEFVRCLIFFGFLRLDIVFEIICCNVDYLGNNFMRNSCNMVIFFFFIVYCEIVICKNKKIFFINRGYGSFKF